MELLSCLPKQMFEVIGIWVYVTIAATGKMFPSMQQSLLQQLCFLLFS